MEEKIFDLPAQIHFFEMLETALPPNTALVDTVMDTLDLGKDAVYRRLRGKTQLSFDEAATLARHFGISLNEVIAFKENQVVFHRNPAIKTEEDFYSHLEETLTTLERLASYKKKQLFYLAKDIPIFYQFKYPELGRFKMYVWMKSVYHIEKIDDQFYGLTTMPEKYSEIAKKLHTAYMQLPVIEVWNDTTILSLLMQIEYFYEAGLLTDRNEALTICRQVNDLIRLIFKQTQLGVRLHPEDEETRTGIPFEIYVNEILIMDNQILAELDNRNYLFVPYSGINLMYTSDHSITSDMRGYVDLQLMKSSNLNKVSERNRNQFFLKMRNKLDRLVDKIETTDPFV